MESELSESEDELFMVEQMGAVKHNDKGEFLSHWVLTMS